MVNWEAVSAIGQVLGALAVVVSLIYLAAQVRQNTRVVRAATFQSVVETSLTFSTAIGAEGERAYTFNRGIAGAEDLTAAEEAQFIYLFHAWIRIVENGHYQFQSGMLEPQLWHGWVETARSLLGAPGGRRMWLTVRPRVRAAFAEFVDREVIPSAGADSAKNFLGSLVKA